MKTKLILHRKNIRRMLLMVIALTVQTGCKKLVEVDPPLNSLTVTNAYLSDATAISVLTGLYAQASNSAVTSAGNIQSLTLFTGLSADELNFTSNIPQTNAYYYNTLSASSGYGTEYWTTMYPLIYQCNIAIEGLNSSNKLTPVIKQQLLGEAKFFRALYYFYLVNLYGDVALPLGTDPNVNQLLPRVSTAQVYSQIIADLKDAQSLLSPNFLDGTLLKTTTDRVRLSQAAATALLARVYLYTGDWADAYTQSTALINNTAQFSLSPLSNVFLKAASGNNEAIWQLQPVTTGTNVNVSDAYYLIVPTTGPGQGGTATSGVAVANNGSYLSDNLYNSFETGDNRQTTWIGSVAVSGKTYHYPYKYKATSGSVVEHEMILRLGEQYLIRAEAEANGAGGGISAAITDLNTIRSRAGLPGYAGIATQTAVLAALYHERQVELFCELGQRWFDLKRTKTLDAVMGAPTGTAQKTSGTTNWDTNQKLYPLPTSDLQYDGNLKQNPGY